MNIPNTLERSVPLSYKFLASLGGFLFNLLMLDLLVLLPIKDLFCDSIIHSWLAWLFKDKYQVSVTKPYSCSLVNNIDIIFYVVFGWLGLEQGGILDTLIHLFKQVPISFYLFLVPENHGV